MKVVGGRLWASRWRKEHCKDPTGGQHACPKDTGEWSQRSRRVNPEACPKGGGRSLSRALSRGVASSLSPPGVEYSLSEGKPCSARLAHSSKYGFGRQPSGP